MARAKLGAILQDVRGGLGETVAANGRSGAVLRRKPTYKYPDLPALEPAKQRMSGAMTLWNSLSRSQAMAWNTYAAGLTYHNKTTGQPYAPTGLNVFSGLANKFLQVHPALTPPIIPPSGGFAGDAVKVSAAGGAGAIAFTASAANGANVLTELLIQPLLTPRRSPGNFYKSAGFVGFIAGHLAQNVAVSAGTYACAYRFVNALTGQATAPVPVGVAAVV